MITIIAKNIVQDNQITKFKTLTEELILETRKEPGCISYSLFEDTKHRNILTFIEEWESQKAVDKHFNTSHFTRIVPQLKPLLSSAAEINLYQKIN